MDQHVLTGLQSAMDEETLPSGEARERHGGRLDMIEARGLGPHSGRLDEQQLGVGTTIPAD
jgi:hypothetical protein